MGATVTVALITWFSTSLLEWRMGRKSERVHQLLINPFFGVLMSLGLGALFGSVGGAGVGIGVVVGNGLGLATNELTYNFFEGIAKTFAAIRRLRTRCTELAVAHSRRLNEVRETLIMGGRAIAKTIYAIIWIFSLPAKTKKKLVAMRS